MRYLTKSIPLVAEFIYLATSAECARLINQPTAVNGLGRFIHSEFLLLVEICHRRYASCHWMDYFEDRLYFYARFSSSKYARTGLDAGRPGYTRHRPHTLVHSQVSVDHFKQFISKKWLPPMDGISKAHTSHGVLL